LGTIKSPADWVRLLAGLTVVFGLFQWSAATLASDRGQAGLFVAALVVGATLAVERLLFGQRLRAAVAALGFGRPRAAGLAVAGAGGVLLLSVIPIFERVTGLSASPWPGWVSLTPGLFAQAGIAEETLFRGYLFGHLRRGRSFWRAALLSMLPFVGVHLFLFFTMPWTIALAAILLAVVLAFPFARAFELGGHTIWAPAILHFVVQTVPKVAVFPSDAALPFALVWMAASALIPALVVWAVSRLRVSDG
jgi:membrane protease YdiL (CAAX protease family)